jgi:hypothetical protein
VRETSHRGLDAGSDGQEWTGSLLGFLRKYGWFPIWTHDEALGFCCHTLPPRSAVTLCPLGIASRFPSPLFSDLSLAVGVIGISGEEVAHPKPTGCVLVEGLRGSACDDLGGVVGDEAGGG